MSLPDTPNTLREKYYSVMAGQNDADILPDIETAPSTENRYLDYIARNGGGGGGDVTKEYVDTAIATAVAVKVDKIEGKGLSTNDYTNADKALVQDSPITTTSSTSPIIDSADGMVQGVTIYGHSQKSKNLLEITAKSQTINGVTFTVDKAAGTITANGTATNLIYFTLTNSCNISKDDNYIITWYNPLSSNSYFAFNNVAISSLDTVSTRYNNLPTGTYQVFYRVPVGTTLNNVTLQILICTVADYEADPTFEPYFEGIKSIGDAGWGVVDLGTLTWTYNSEIQAFNSEISNIKINSNNDIIALCAVYNSVASYTELIATNKTTWINNTQHKIVIRDTSYTDATTFKSAMSGVLLYYPLADTTGATPIFGITSKNGEGQGTAATITTGLPLRSTLDGTVYDELTNDKVITRCEVVEGEVVPLATPVETPLTSTEIAALAALQTYNNITHINATDAPIMTVNYLLNTNNGKAVANIQKDLQEQIDDLGGSFAETILYDNMNLTVEPAANVQCNLSQPYTNFDEIKIEYAYIYTGAGNNKIYPIEYRFSVADLEAMRTSSYNGRKGYLLFDRYLNFANMYISMDITSTSILTIDEAKISSNVYKHYITKITGIKY